VEEEFIACAANNRFARRISDILGSSDQIHGEIARACNNSVLFKYRIIDVSVKTEVCTSVRSDS